MKLNMGNDNLKAPDIFKEDELAMFIKAVKHVRAVGAGIVLLHFRNGYVFKVGAQIDEYNTTKKGKER